MSIWAPLLDQRIRLSLTHRPDRNALVKNTFPCTYRGKIETKDRGKMDMYFVD